MNRATLSLSGLGSFHLAASAPASAATAPAQSVDYWLWLAHLPDAVPGTMVVVLLAGLFWVGFRLIRRFHKIDGQSHRRSSYYAALAGGLIGVLIVLLGTESWNTFIYHRISNLPPSASGPPADHQPAIPLLSEAAPQFAGARPQMPESALIHRSDRARHAEVNFNALNANTLSLNLFDDELPWIAVRHREVSDLQGGTVWVGTIAGYEDSEVILAAKGRTLAGTINVDGRLFEIVYVNGNTHAVRELDLQQLPPDHPPGAVEEEPETAETRGDTSGTMDTAGTGTASTGQVIDVFVVYTPNARTNAGGDSGIQSKIMSALVAANQAYLNSKIDLSLNLVGMALTNYTETNSMGTTRTRLVSATDGYMDEVHALRNQYAADLVVLISTDTNYCGLSAVMKAVSTSFAPYALAVVRDGCLSAGSFAHEIGHMQGNEHDPDNAVGYYGAYPDSYGYRVCGKFRDIMSYSCSGEPRVAYFSNPNITYLGYPTGITGSNDTARSMNITAPTVANFRVTATTTTVPSAPGSLMATASNSSAIALAWTDNATDEVGYKVQRSYDGANWNEIASLSQNAAGYADSGLSAGQPYFYRIYAYNSMGNSAYSNTASATPVAPVTDSTPPTINIVNPQPNTTVSGTVQISVSASDAGGLSGVKLYLDNALVGASNGGSLIYSWNTKKAAAGNHSIRVDALDIAGNLGSASVSVIK